MWKYVAFIGSGILAGCALVAALVWYVTKYGTLMLTLGTAQYIIPAIFGGIGAGLCAAHNHGKKSAAEAPAQPSNLLALEAENKRLRNLLLEQQDNNDKLTALASQAAQANISLLP